MGSYNRVMMLGNVVRDFELKQLTSGTAVVDLTLAVNDRVKRDGNWVDDPTFVDTTLFGRTAEVAAEYLSKGSSCFIEGRLKLDTWEKDGQKRSKLKVIGEKLQLLGGKPSSNSSATPTDTKPQGVSPQQANRAKANAAEGDEIPW